MIRTEHLSDSVTLHLGDCLDALPTLPRAGAVVSDPPYGVGYSHGVGGGKLARCAGCRTAAYCGAEHQRIAWRCGHKAACAALATQRSADNSSSAAV